ncbi:MAG: FtsX-like permease family protein [Bacteroidota bacterium]
MVIAMMPIVLFGLISFIALSRTKEIDIRETLGANVNRIVFLLCSEFMILVILGNVLAAPIIIDFGKSSLSNFAYHTNTDHLISS